MIPFHGMGPASIAVAATLYTSPNRAAQKKREARQLGSSNVDKEKDGWPWARGIEKPTVPADPTAETEKSEVK
ncbi:hypothetical protein VTI74DRAFT_3654 [Chaetomium olivicolor]